MLASGMLREACAAGAHEVWCQGVNRLLLCHIATQAAHGAAAMQCLVVAWCSCGVPITTCAYQAGCSWMALLLLLPIVSLHPTRTPLPRLPLLLQMQNLVQSLNNMQLQGMQAPAYVAQGAGMSPGFSAAAQAPLVPAMQLSPHAGSGGGMAVPASPPQASQQQWVVPAAAMLAASSAPVATGGFAGTVLGNDSGMLQANWVAVSEALVGASNGMHGTSPPMSGGLLAPLAASAAGGGGGAYLHNTGLSNAAAAAQMVQMTQLYAASNTLQSAAMVAPINV